MDRKPSKTLCQRPTKEKPRRQKGRVQKRYRSGKHVVKPFMAYPASIAKGSSKKVQENLKKRIVTKDGKILKKKNTRMALWVTGLLVAPERQTSPWEETASDTRHKAKKGVGQPGSTNKEREQQQIRGKNLNSGH